MERNGLRIVAILALGFLMLQAYLTRAQTIRMVSITRHDLHQGEGDRSGVFRSHVDRVAAQHRLQRTGDIRRPKACCAIIELLGPAGPAPPPPACRPATARLPRAVTGADFPPTRCIRACSPFVAPRLRADALSNRWLLAGTRFSRLLSVDRARLHSVRSVPLAPSPWSLFLHCWY